MSNARTYKVKLNGSYGERAEGESARAVLFDQLIAQLESEARLPAIVLPRSPKGHAAAHVFGGDGPAPSLSIEVHPHETAPRP